METLNNNENDALKLMAEQNELLRHNIELSEQILEKTEYLKTYVKWQKVWGVVKVMIVVIPLIIGALYLPPLIKDYIDQFNYIKTL